MHFDKSDFIDTLYETSKSNDNGDKSGALLTSKEGGAIDVYNLDRVKIDFCECYRKNELSSCDAFFCNQYDTLVIEFKNTNHISLLEYMDDIIEKLIDTHMLLLETFYRNKSANKLAGNVKLLVVYHDTRNYESGVMRLNKQFNEVIPKQGNKVRNTEPVEEVYNQKVEEVKNIFQKDFYSEVEFMDKKDFMEFYVNNGTLEGLV